ncbi:MAG: NUDIX domain-containing protein [Candidatus Peregrinibacteria bacterium]
MPQHYPEPTVGALIVNPEGKIFLMASPKWKGKYVIPGGHVELGETLEDALRREVKEETNLDIFDIKFLAFLEFIYGPGFEERKHFLFFDYTCKTQTTKVQLNEEGTNFVWVTSEEALKLPVESNTEIIIRRYVESVETSE